MRRTSTLLALAILLTGGAAQAADLTVFTAGSMLEPLKAAGADYTRATGTGLVFVSGAAKGIAQRVKAGEKADVVVVLNDAMPALQAGGSVAPGSAKPLADGVYGLAVKTGAPKPDISTSERFVQALHAASAIAYPDPKGGATAGLYLQALFDRLGIADEMRAKSLYQPSTAQGAAAVTQGKADLVISFISELQPSPGVTVVGPLPAGIQNLTLYTAGVATTSADPAAAKAFIAFVTSPGERGKLKAAGVEPVGP